MVNVHSVLCKVLIFHMMHPVHDKRLHVSRGAVQRWDPTSDSRVAAVREEYDFSHLIGGGQFGMAWAATERETGQAVAVKFFNEDGGPAMAENMADPEMGRGRSPEEVAAAVRNECRMNKAMHERHPKLFVDCVVNLAETGPAYIVMGVAGTQDLEKAPVCDQTIEQQRLLVGQLFSAVRVMVGDKEHTTVAHMDMATRNLMVDESFAQLTVIDLGEAVEYDHDAEGPLISFGGTKLLYNVADLAFLLSVALGVEKNGCFKSCVTAAKMALVRAGLAKNWEDALNELALADSAFIGLDKPRGFDVFVMHLLNALGAVVGHGGIQGSVARQREALEAAASTAYAKGFLSL